MPTQLKLSDILNILSIGIIFQIIILCFMYNLNQEFLLEKANKIDPALLTGLVIIFSFPSWRLVSNFVDFILAPQTRNINRQTYIISKDFELRRKLYLSWKNFLYLIIFLSEYIPYNFNKYYRLVFFKLKPSQGINPNTLAIKLNNSNPTNLDLEAIKNIQSKFNINLKSLPYQEYKSVYYLVKSYITINRTEHQELLFERYHMVFNYHVRLAILANLLTLTSMFLLIYNFVDKFYFDNPIKNVLHDKHFYLIILSIIVSRHFGEKCKDYNISGNYHLLIDFNNLANSKK